MKDLTKPQRFFPPAATYIHDPQDMMNALEGYRLFFGAFTMDDPRNYISFDAYAYKHYAAPTRPATNQVFARKDGVVIATEWYMDLPIIHGGRTYRCVHGADVCATEEGRGLPFLRMHSLGERLLKEMGYELRVSAPNSNSMKFIERFGAKVLGDRRVMDATVGQVRERCRELVRDRGEGMSISYHRSCPFTQTDYDLMNAPSGLIRSVRDATYFAYRVDGLVERNSTYVVSRSQGKLVGYLILRWDACGRATVFDWDLFEEDEDARRATLACLLMDASDLYEYLFIPQLGEPHGEVKLFQDCGFEFIRDADGSPVGDKFVVTPYVDDLDPAFLDFGSWRQRLIDKDYGLNATRG